MQESFFRGATILLVEQNEQQALNRGHGVYVFETGLISKVAKAKYLLYDPLIRSTNLRTGANEIF